ncbi:MAG: hypothetical protein IJO83_01565 [Clostridia bacterium]|nr:hypothetical protein [Clostridia bacterium]
MKKVLLTVFFSLTILLSFGFASQASTLDNIDIYLKYDALDRMMSTEQKAPTSITDAGEERIDTYTGGVSYYSEELNLPGKNGLDLIVGRKFNSAADIDIWGESQYISVKDYRNLSNPSEACKYVFPYHLSEDCSDEPIFVAFDTVWHMLQAEDETTMITVSSAYADEAIDLRDTNDDYEWGIDQSCDAGLTFDTAMYVYDDITGNDIVLYRDLRKKYNIIWSSRPTSSVFIHDRSYTKVLSLGGGWEYDVPIVLGWEGSYLGNYDCMYGMFYDSYQKESVCYRIKYDNNKVLDAVCYYTKRPITNSENPYTGTNAMYTIEADIDNGKFYYTITRTDGVEFSFCEDELQTMTDRFGNTMSFDYSKNSYIKVTDTLGRLATLTTSGITVNGEQIVSYTFDRYNNEVEDPNEHYYEDDYCTFTASYKVGTNSLKNIVYNHSQGARIFYLTGNAPLCSQTVGYTKMVLDNILLPTGAQRIYDYGEIDRRQYFNSSSKTDYACISRYDLQADSTTEENWQEYDYGEKSATPTTITTFPGRTGYTITETFDSEGCVTTRVTECEDLEYTTTESYTYTTVGGSFRVKEECITKESTDASTVSYEKAYTYHPATHNIATIKLDDTLMYKAAYGDYGLQTYEYNIYNTSQYRGIKNTITDGTITAKKYVTLYGISDSSPTVEETVTYTYDSYGNLASMDGEGVYVEYSYEYGDYSSGSEPDYSIIITETYPDVENITNSSGVDIPSADVTKTSYYDKWGNLVKTVDGEGNTTTYTYDYRGRLLTQKNPDNTTLKYQYNDTSNNIYITNEDGSRNMVRFDSLGREYNYYYYNPDINAYSAIYLKRYNVNGQMRGYYLYSNRAVDSVVRYTYYSDGSLKSEIVREGESTSGPIMAQNTYTYTIPETNTFAASVTRKKTDTENVTITNYTNQYGYKVKDTISDGADEAEQVYTTDVAGNITEVYDFLGNRSHKYIYDYRGRVTKDTYPIGSTTNVYDGSYLYQVKDGLGNVAKTYEYNTQGQLIRETTPIDDDTDNITEYYYDRNGNLTKTVTTTGDGTTTKTVSTRYDNRNRPTAVNDGSGYYTRYEYDSGSRISKMATGVATATEALDRDTHYVTDYEYSYQGFLTAMTDPMGYTESYTNNSRGIVLSFVDKNGTVTEYDYDGLDRLASKTATGTNGTTQSLSYEYDYLGNVSQMVDENGSTLYTYDRLGNTLTETLGNLVKEYEYDANGNRTSANFDDGIFEQKLTYKYDENNRLTKITINGGHGYTEYVYNANNLVTSKKTYNSGGTVRAYTKYEYYDSGLLKTKKNYTHKTTTSSYFVDDYALTYYADSNIASVENNDAVTEYVYDPTGRLSSESIDGALQASYTYDAFGNRATMITPEGTTTYTYDKNNRLTQSAGTTYTYDNNGNLLSKSGALTGTYAFDLLGRMTSSDVNNVVSTYAYDGNGIRTSKTVSGVTTNFINDGAYVVGEVSGDSVVKYIYGNGLINIINNGTIGYYHTDEHGNVSAISNFDREIVADYDFDAFGNETVSTDTYYNPMRYCGEYQDKETGNIYLRARYYDPSIGRFISEDPIKDGTNWYVYCSNNPIAFVDPSGLIKEGDENLSEEIQILLNGENKDGSGGLSAAWQAAYEREDAEAMAAIEAEADELRKYDVNSIKTVTVLLNSSAAKGAGHTATILVNSDGYGIIFSYYAKNGKMFDDGESRIAVLTPEECQKTIYQNESVKLITQSGYVKEESYDDRFNISMDSKKGANGISKIASIFNNPKRYNIGLNNCDHKTASIVEATGNFYHKRIFPNNSHSESSWFYETAELLKNKYLAN